MTDAQPGEPATPPATTVPRRNPYVVLLLAVGSLMTIGGVIGWLAAKVSADQASAVGSAIPTLPVFVYTQFTQGSHSIAPDYLGLWIGAVVAILGVAVLLAGVIVASTKPRAA